jgi:hypothetical protein
MNDYTEFTEATRRAEQRCFPLRKRLEAELERRGYHKADVLYAWELRVGVREGYASDWLAVKSTWPDWRIYVTVKPSYHCHVRHRVWHEPKGGFDFDALVEKMIPLIEQAEASERDDKTRRDERQSLDERLDELSKELPEDYRLATSRFGSIELTLPPDDLDRVVALLKQLK